MRGRIKGYVLFLKKESSGSSVPDQRAVAQVEPAAGSWIYENISISITFLQHTRTCNTCLIQTYKLTYVLSKPPTAMVKKTLYSAEFCQYDIFI